MPTVGELTLLLRLSAPLQSWGSGSKSTDRDTDREPTFSGVVGLVANALGRIRSDAITDLAELWFATRVDVQGRRMRDFYTAGTTTGVAQRTEITSLGDTGRSFRDIISQKDGLPTGVVGVKHYLAGASFTAVLAGNADLLTRCGEALQRPARPLYLGRRSCPNAAPIFGGLLAEDPENVLRTAPALPGSRVDERMRLSLPSGPADPLAQIRFDHPLDFSDIHRRYVPRYVRTDWVASADLRQRTLQEQR